MPTLLKKDLDSILEKTNESLNDYPNFVETGTFMGETILRFVDYFENLFTIELSEVLYNEFNRIEYDRTKLKSFLGDSSVVLPNVINELRNNTIFFLDGHYSSGSTARGTKDVPLYEELKNINDLYFFGGLIIIDDLRLFGTKLNEDWSYVNTDSLLSTLGNRIETFFEENDRLIIKIKKINL
jgi:hypothetical protein